MNFYTKINTQGRNVNTTMIYFTELTVDGNERLHGSKQTISKEEAAANEAGIDTLSSS